MSETNHHQTAGYGGIKMIKLYFLIGLIWSHYAVYMQAKVNKDAEAWKFIPVLILNLLFYPVCIIIAYIRGTIKPR